MTFHITSDIRIQTESIDESMVKVRYCPKSNFNKLVKLRAMIDPEKLEALKKPKVPTAATVSGQIEL
jgi:hypothetical protein